jgi:hypothetical protein
MFSITGYFLAGSKIAADLNGDPREPDHFERARQDELVHHPGRNYGRTVIILCKSSTEMPLRMTPESY